MIYTDFLSKNNFGRKVKVGGSGKIRAILGITWANVFIELLRTFNKKAML